MRGIVPLVVLGILIGLSPGRAIGSEPQGFNAAVADAYASYRQTLFYLRTGNAMVAGIELDELAAKWKTVIKRFGGTPPAPYAGDTAWNGTLAQIQTHVDQALAALDTGDARACAEALAPVRGILSDLRRRNGVVVFSDHIDELSAALDVLANYRREVTDLGDNAAAEPVRRQAAVVEYLFNKLRERAPAAIARQEEFRRALEGVEESMARLWQSFESRDIRLYRIAIGELHAHERLLYLRFG